EIRDTLRPLDGLTPPDKATLLRRATAYRDSGITRMDPPPFALPKPRPVFIRRPLATAATLLILVGIIGGTVLGADAYTYGKASAFFEEYGLSTEGLEREDLWEVYRDITTGQFRLPDTAYMLQSNLGLTPSGSLSAGEVESLWEEWKEAPSPDMPEGIISSPRDIVRRICFVRTRYPEQTTDVVNYQLRTPCFEPDIEAEKAALVASAINPALTQWDTIERSEFYYSVRYDSYTGRQCLFKFNQDDAVIWSYPVGDLQMARARLAGEYIVVTGSTKESQNKDIHVLLFTQDGKLCWQTVIDNGDSESVSQVLYEDDVIKLISKADFKNICYTVLDPEGNVLQNVVNQQDADPNVSFSSVVPFKNGYILISYGGKSLFIMDQNGVVTDYCDYSDAQVTGDDGDEDFRIEDVFPANDRLYIRIEVTDKREYGQPIDSALALIRERFSDPDTFSELADLPYNDIIMTVREAYRSLLLVCDADTFEPIAAYQMNEAYPSIANMTQNSDGSIVWTSGAPYVTVYSPYTSAYTLRGTSYDYVYTIRPDGTVEDDVRVYIGSDYYG
ncbi:MAG: hypothetical protein IJX72_02205, partial [Clostridia bacterium]|nr:hypothetical protein [Clostridia bacterium]